MAPADERLHAYGFAARNRNLRLAVELELRGNALQRADTEIAAIRALGVLREQSHMRHVIPEAHPVACFPQAGDAIEPDDHHQATRLTTSDDPLPEGLDDGEREARERVRHMQARMDGDL